MEEYKKYYTDDVTLHNVVKVWTSSQHVLKTYQHEAGSQYFRYFIPSSVYSLSNGECEMYDDSCGVQRLLQNGSCLKALHYYIYH